MMKTKILLAFSIVFLLLCSYSNGFFEDDEVSDKKGRKGGKGKLFDSTSKEDWEAVHGKDFELPPDMVAAVIARRKLRQKQMEENSTLAEKRGHGKKDKTKTSRSKRNRTFEALSQAEIQEDGDLVTVAAAQKIIDHENQKRLEELNITDDYNTETVKRSPEEIKEILEKLGFSDYGELDDYIDYIAVLYYDSYDDYDDFDDEIEDILSHYYDDYYTDDFYNDDDEVDLLNIF